MRRAFVPVIVAALFLAGCTIKTSVPQVQPTSSPAATASPTPSASLSSFGTWLVTTMESFCRLEPGWEATPVTLGDPIYSELSEETQRELTDAGFGYVQSGSYPANMDGLTGEAGEGFAYWERWQTQCLSLRYLVYVPEGTRDVPTLGLNSVSIDPDTTRVNIPGELWCDVPASQPSLMDFIGGYWDAVT